MTQNHSQSAAGQARPLLHTEDAIKARLFVDPGYVRRLHEALECLPHCRYKAASDLLAQALGLIQGQPTAAEVGEALDHMQALKDQVACVQGCADVDEAKGYATLIASELRRWVSYLRLESHHQAAKRQSALRHTGEGGEQILAAIFLGRKGATV